MSHQSTLKGWMSGSSSSPLQSDKDRRSSGSLLTARRKDRSKPSKKRVTSKNPKSSVKKRDLSPDSDCQIIETSPQPPKKRQRVSLGDSTSCLSDTLALEVRRKSEETEKALKEKLRRMSASYTPKRRSATSVSTSAAPSKSESKEPPPGSSTSSQSTVNDVESQPLSTGDGQEGEEEKEEKEEEEKEPGEEEEEKRSEFAVPYYLENFLIVLETVLSDSYHQDLFSDDELEWRRDFQDMEDSEQKLFIRLYGRKNRWMRRNQIKYDKIDTDLDPVLDRLVEAGFLLTDTSEEGLPTLLDLLSASELAVLGKDYKLRQGARSQEVKDGLLERAARKSLTSFVDGATSVKQQLVKRVRSLIGSCYRVDMERRSFFNRVLMLYTLTSSALDDDDAGQVGQKELFEMLRVKIGQVKYPVYETNRKSRIFSDREDLMQLEQLEKLESNLVTEMDKKDFEAAVSVCEVIERDFAKSERFTQWSSYAMSLPTFLRAFTPGGKTVRLMTAAVDAAEKHRRYDTAVDLLRWLLDQEAFHLDYRGRWWERLTLDLERHLRQPGEALKAARLAMKDPHVVGGRRLAIHVRGERVTEIMTKGKSKPEPWPTWNVLEAPAVVISGCLLPGTHPVWIREGDEKEALLCGVEQLALQHYQDVGFPRGIHGETSTLWTLFVLLFRDIVMLCGDSVPDAFLGPHQTGPLDLNDSAFYNRRQELFDSRFDWLETAEDKDISAEVSRVWLEHEGERCISLNTDLFHSAEDAVDLILCIGGRNLVGMFRRLSGAEDASPIGGGRHWKSGFPDLLVWHPEERKYRVVEVKGPTDRLSNKQRLWLDLMLRLGMDVEVCHVKAVGAKKLQKAGDSKEHE